MFALITLQSCYKAGSIEVQNNISQVEILDVKWGEIYLSSELLPGQTSEKISIEKREKKLPFSSKISFTMYANSKTIYLETQEEFLLNEDQDLLIILDDNTKVKNPN